MNEFLSKNAVNLGIMGVCVVAGVAQEVMRHKQHKAKMKVWKDLKVKLDGVNGRIDQHFAGIREGLGK